MGIMDIKKDIKDSNRIYSTVKVTHMIIDQ